MDEAAGKNSSPVHYTWVNATCHTEIFSYFNVEPTSLPTIVYLHQQHNKYGVMIGKFDEESIEEHEDKFKNGKMALSDVKVDKRELQFTDIDCAAQVLEQMDEDDDDVAEFLAEIRAEEEARKAAEDPDYGKTKSKKKSSSKKKTKKKGKKDAQSDEL